MSASAQHRAKLYGIADRQEWLVGETFERAVEALEQELENGAGQGDH